MFRSQRGSVCSSPRMFVYRCGRARPITAGVRSSTLLLESGKRVSWSSLLLLLQFPPDVFLVDHSSLDFKQKRNRLLSRWLRNRRNFPTLIRSGSVRNC